MSAHQAVYPIRTMCRVLEVSPSGYYAWRKRSPSARAQEDAVLTRRIQEVHTDSRGTYGSPRIHAELREEGTRVGRKRVARLMRQSGLQGVSRRRSVTTTQRAENARPAPDLVDRDFAADGPDQLWVADIPYIPTWAGFLYLAVVLDAWSRRIVGWAMATHLRTQLVLDALDMALWQRRPVDVIHHSDQGSQGGFNRSSQRLTREVVQWSRSDDGPIERSGPRCAPRVALRRLGESTGRCSGRRSPGACPVEKQREKPESHPLSERAGFGTVGACHPPRFARCRAGTCHSRSARRSPCCGPKGSVSAQ